MDHHTRRLKKTVGFDEGMTVVELATGVRIEFAPSSGSIALVRLVVAYPKDTRGRGTVGHRQQVEYIDDLWQTFTLYYLCWTWFWDLLFTKRGGFRAAVRAAGVLKDVRDACRVRRRLLDASGGVVP